MNDLRSSDAVRLQFEEDGQHPTGLPVTMSMVKEYLRVDSAVDDEDTYLTSSILAAERVLVQHTGIQIRQRQFKARMAELPKTHLFNGTSLAYIQINPSPLISLTIEINGDEVDPEAIKVYTYNRRSFVCVSDIDTLNIPAVDIDAVEFIAQIGLVPTPDGEDPWTIPPEAQIAICKMVAFNFQNREGFDRGRPAVDLNRLVLNEYISAMGFTPY